MRPFLSRVKSLMMRQLPMQGLAARFGKSIAPDKWIFVIGCYNSGTTLLAQLLANHSQVGTLSGEGIVFSDRLERPEEHGWPRMWFKCREAMQVQAEDPASLAERIKKQWSWAAISKGSCFLEKSIANATRLDFFNQHFQPAYFIHITRNGYAVAEGIRRKTSPARWKNQHYNNRYPIDLCAEQWAATEELIESQKSGLSNYRALSYESLAADPYRELKNLLEFLELEWEDNLLGDEVSVHGLRGPITDMNQESIARLERDEIEQINRVAGAQLQRLGYLQT